MKTRLEMRDMRIDYAPLAHKEWFVTMTSVVTGRQVGATKATRQQALEAAVKEMEYANDLDCLRYRNSGSNIHFLEPARSVYAGN